MANSYNLDDKLDRSNNLFKRIINSKALGIIALGAGIMLSGCRRKIDSGEVYEKRYEPERRWVQPLVIPQVHKIGKSTYTTYLVIPMFFYDDEDYIIKIRQYNEEKGKYDTRTFYVDRETYENVQIGDYFQYNGKNARLEDKIVKRRATKEEQEKLGIDSSSG